MVTVIIRKTVSTVLILLMAQASAATILLASPSLQIQSASSSQASNGRDTAIEILRKKVLLLDAYPYIAFMWPEPLMPGDYITTSYFPENNTYLIETVTWFFWIEDSPYEGFAHDTRYVFIENVTGDYIVAKASWWPKLNGVDLWPTPSDYWNTTYWVNSTIPYSNSTFQYSLASSSQLDSSSACVLSSFYKSNVVSNVQSPGKKREVIIEGPDKQGHMRKNAENWYKLFKNDFGYIDVEIIYLSPKKDRAHVDKISTKANVEATLKNLGVGGADELKPCDQLSIYITAHGADKTKKNARALAGGDTLTDDELDTLVCKIKDGVHITIVIQGCYSGSFIDNLKKHKKKVEVVITATDDKTTSYGDLDNPALEKMKDLKKKWLDEDVTPTPDPNDDCTTKHDEGSEFSSGLIEDLKALAKKFKEGKITRKELYRQAFKTAKEKDAALLNQGLLKQMSEIKKALEKLLKKIEEGKIPPEADLKEELKKEYDSVKCTEEKPENPQLYFVIEYGGIATPVDKLALVARYIALAVALVAVTVGTVYVTKRRSRKAVVPKP